MERSLGRPGRRITRILACASLLAVGLAAVPGGERARRQPSVPQRTDSKHVRETLRLLAPSRLRGRIQEEIAADLAALGPEAAPAFVALLAGTLEGPIGADFAEDPPLAAGDVDRELPRIDVLLLAALARLPDDAVADAVVGLTGGAAPTDVRLVAMRVLATTGRAEGVAAWLEVTGGMSAIDLERAYVRGPIERALAAILARDVRAFDRLAAVGRALERKLAPLVVRAVAASGRAEGIAFLIAELGRDRDLDLVLLAEIGRLAERTSGGLSESDLEWIRPFAEDDDWRVRREALLALGRVGDPFSFEAQCAALDDPQRLVQQAAAWSLRTLSGQELGVDAERWLRWYDSEREWFLVQGASAIDEVVRADPATIVDALRRLTPRRLFRHEIAAAVTIAARAESAPVAIAACGALGELGTLRGAPALLDALASEDEGVRKAAHAALERLAGAKLPRDAEACARALRLD